MAFRTCSDGIERALGRERAEEALDGGGLALIESAV